jgi:hypothetical protein
MKRKYWIIGIIIFIVIDIIIFLVLYPSSPAQNIPGVSPEQQDNETETPWRFPKITFPWSSEETSGSGAEGGSGGAGEGSGAGGAGSGEPEVYVPPYYTLYVESDPSNLEVFVNYTVDGVILNITQEAPYSLIIDSGSTACLVAAKIRGSGTLKWIKDGEQCPATECYSPFYGCAVLMDSDHTVTEQWIAA